jgi:hypothetical protein
MSRDNLSTMAQANRSATENKRRLYTQVLKEGTIVAVLFTIATIILTYPAILHLRDGLPDRADPLLNSWILAWDAHALVTDPFNLYNANTFYPYSNTLAYSETLLGQALVAAPIIWVTSNPVLALNICWFLTFILSGLAMYALVRDITGASLPAFAAGMVFAFNSFRFAHVAHIQLLSAQWIPLSLFFLIRLFRRQQWADAFGLWLSFNLQVLSCYYYGLFTAVALGVFALTHWIIWRPRVTRRLLVQVAGVVLLAAALQIPLSIPYFKVAGSLDFERSLIDIVRGGADLIDFLTVPPGNRLFGSATAPFRGVGWWEHVAFPGLVALSLAGLALTRKALRVERNAVVVWGVLALAGFILSLGPALKLNGQELFAPLPYRALFEFVPGFRAIRQPARFHIVTMTGLSVLAGLGLAGLTERLSRRTDKLALAGVVIACIGIETWSLPLTIYPILRPEEIPPVYRWLAEQPDEGPILELPILMDVGSTEAPRLYYSTVHWKRMVNGYGGFFPPTYAYFLFFDREFPAQPYDWIVGLGIRYVVLHRWQYSPNELQAIDAGLADFSGLLNLVADFEIDQVYEVIHPTTKLPNSPNLIHTLDRNVRLLGYVLKSPSAGESPVLEVKLFWQCLRPMDRDYTVFVHLVDETGTLVAQQDGQPANGTKPTSGCLHEEVVVDTHTLDLPTDLPEGQVSLRVGMYDLRTMRRLPVHGLDGMMVQDFLHLGDLHLESEQ